jgi:TATA-box binding protein (TBP) (component of TFIID and TFIIIB)
MLLKITNMQQECPEITYNNLKHPGVSCHLQLKITNMQQECPENTYNNLKHPGVSCHLRVCQ